MSKVLVTGATGFIGKHLVKQLLQRQLPVRVLIRNPQDASQFPDHVEIFVGDLTNQNSLIGACYDIDTVFHLGGYAHAWGEGNAQFVAQHKAINFEGTQNILEEGKRSNIKKFIFFSSVKAVADSEKSINEDWDQTPNTAYGLAKREAEQIILAAQNSGVHVCVLRPALVYGPDWKGNLASMLRAIDKGLFPPLPKIKNARSLVSTNDICDAAILAAEQPQANGKIYFVTDGIEYSTRQLYDLMCESLGKRTPKWYVPFWLFKLLAVAGDTGKKVLKKRMPFDSDALSKLFGSAAYNSTKIQLELGFQPKHNLHTMLPEIIKQYRAQ